MHPFAAAFADAWSAPTPERLVALLHPDVTLLQPHLPPVHGRDAAHAELQRLLRWMPDLHGEVDRACGNDAVVFIEWRMKRTRNTRPGIRAVDRFLLDGDLGTERRVWFDQFALLAEMMRAPHIVPGFFRYRFGRRAR